MASTAFVDVAHHWAQTGLVWIGFGTVVGLLAKAIMPGRDQGGALATLLMGIGGTIVGLGILAYCLDERVTPLSFIGFAAALGGASVILFFHRMLQGYYFKEKGTGMGSGPHRGNHHAAVIVRD
jgi:uncharacterized membrane protein YeaQ/YmgE (transglycosylase-associated protein family)